MRSAKTYHQTMRFCIAQCYALAYDARMATDTHAALLGAFIERHDLTKVRAAELLGLSDPGNAGRVAVTRWLKGGKCQIPLGMLRAALSELERQLAARGPSSGEG